MQNTLDFQTIMMTLQQYWAEKGCLIWQPYYSQVGAGTMNPATFLRVLGPEPWNVAYIEPSIRPDDGRYGDNPYRMQQHYQFQVILKPDPGNPQEIYLQSLQALGINPQEHDIRFVEDNWVSPALGAWGLGWEVWLDGQEITQFTYFQQAGGINLDPVSVEITYGLERIAMALQGSYHFCKIQWNDNLTYGDVNYMAEKEHSTYYFKDADINRLRDMYDLFEKEADLSLKKGLVLPAHDYILKCSHTFNVLDTRGAIGVTERQALFGRMRDLSRRTAEAYVAQREALEYPWLKKQPISVSKSASTSPSQIKTKKLPESSDYLMEIGTEELPAKDLQDALSQLESGIPKIFDELRLDYKKISVFGTPRRLAIYVNDLSSTQKDQSIELKGPPANRAFDAEGNPSPAATGFARSKGLKVTDLKKKEIDGGEYLIAEIHEKGKSIEEILPKKLVSFIANIKFYKSMRWNASGVTFSRPIRWLVSIYDRYEIPFIYAGLTAGRTTRGLRFSEAEEVTLNNTTDYFPFLTSQGIICDKNKRKQVIREQIVELLSSVGSSNDIDENLLSEVNNLIEAPTSLIGNFDKAHLELPHEVLVGVMKKHQRYFPVFNTKGNLTAHFITVRNGGEKHLDVVTRGNEEVIQARFADAAFFMKEDSETSLEEFLPKLDSLTFHPKLGSMRDKSKRIENIIGKISSNLSLSKEDISAAKRAAHLCKSDLVSNMVIEMTSLQGTIGKYYAKRDGESNQVAQAIEEHYLPRQAGGNLPQSKPGLAVGLADRLDSLIGLFAVNMAPSGTKDPFGLRRAAIGIVQNLIQLGINFNIEDGIEIASSVQPVQVSPEHKEACLKFIIGRLQNLLMDDGHRYDVVNSILAEQGINPSSALKAIKELETWVDADSWSEILPAYSRCVRITRDYEETFKINKKKLVMDEEKTLLDYTEKAAAALSKSPSINKFLDLIQEMMPAINIFFENTLVMDKDESVKHNRLAILQKLSALSKGIVDLSVIEGF